MSALQREVSRLTEDMGGRQEEKCLLRGKVREQEEIAEQKEKERVQLHLQLCGSQQQVYRQRLSVCLSVCLSVYLSIYPSICISLDRYMFV